MEKQNSYTHILKYTGLFGGVQGLNIFVGLVRNKIVAMLLGPVGIGLLALYSSAVKFVGDATNFGLSISAVRDISGACESGDATMLERHVAVFRHWCLLTALLGTAVCLALSPWLSRWTFSSGVHTVHFAMLAPMVGATTFTAGELAVLKATRRLRDVALSSVWGAVAALLLSVPVYVWLGNGGIVLALLLVTFAQMAIVMRFSTSAYPMKVVFSWRMLREGRKFLGLGVAFVLAGIAGSGAEMGIRACLNRIGGADMVGLYNAAYVMIFTYAGMVFTSMETDYYPRLSSVESLGKEFYGMVNSQMEVSLHLVSPLLVAFMTVMPLLLPLMYSGKFMPVLPMMQVAVLSMYARALYMPVEYIALSRGDSLMYMFVEFVAAALLVGFVAAGFCCFGLWGAGLGIAVASFVELAFVCVCCRLRYGYVPSATLLRAVAVHLSVGACAYAATFLYGSWIYWIAGGTLFAAEGWYTLNVLRKNTDIIAKIKKRIKKLG